MDNQGPSRRVLAGLKSRLVALGTGTFGRAVAVMLTGSVLAQAMPMLAAPILARLYTPEAYGRYALFQLIAYTIATLGSLRYEMAVLNAEDEREAATVLVLAMGLSSAVGLFVAASVFVVQTRWPAWLGFVGGSAANLLAPMAILQGCFQALNYWQLRRQRFRELSATRVIRAFAVSGTNIGLGAAGFLVTGLVWGALLGQAVSTLTLGYLVLRDSEFRIRTVRFRDVAISAKKFKGFALYSLPADLLSTLTAQLPIVFLGEAARGFFSFAMTVLGAPLSFVAATFHDAFKERASRDFREQGHFSDVFADLALVLSLLALAPLVLLLAAGPGLFALVFGEPWRVAGQFARILSIMFALKLVASPLSYAYFVVGRQREDLWLHVYIAASTAALLGWGSRANWPATTVLSLFASNYVVFYLVFFVRSWRFSRPQKGVGNAQMLAVEFPERRP